MFVFLWLMSPAQDNIYSFYQFSTLQLNPALAGSGNHSRIIANYRNQWFGILGSDLYRSVSISFDKPVFLKNDNKLGLGTQINFDQAGVSKFRTMDFGLNMAYHIKLGERNGHSKYLIAGIYAAIVRRSLSRADLRWGSQHDGTGGFNPDLPAEDLNESFFYGDLSLGLGYNVQFDDERVLFIGGTIYHPHTPNISFFDNSTVDLRRRYSIYGYYEIKTGSKLDLTPGFLLSFQGKLRFYDLGIGGKLKFNKARNTAIELRSSLRAGRSVNSELVVNAIILSAIYTSKFIMIGVNHEVELNDGLKEITRSRGFEIILGYTFSGKTKSKKN